MTKLDEVREILVGRIITDVVFFEVDNYDGSTCKSYRIDTHDGVSVEFDSCADDNESWLNPVILRGLK